MKKMIRLASMAAALLLMAACTQEELVNQPVEKNNNGMTAMSFSARVPNMTRATGTNTSLPIGMSGNFGVYAAKTVSGIASCVMGNYKVVFDATNPQGSTIPTDDPNHPSSEKGYSYWYYEGVEGSGSEAQKLVYWDDNATKYNFYAYTPYEMYTVADPMPTSITRNLSGGTTEPNFMTASTEITTTIADHNDVPFAFKHVNGKVIMKFYTDIKDYDVTINSITLKTVSDDPATPEDETTKVTTATDVTVSSTGIDVASKTTGSLNQPFTAPTGNLPTDKASAVASGTTYFCMPSSTTSGNENGALIVTVTYTLTAKVGTETMTKTVDVNIPTGSATKWLQNTAYTYYFKIGGLTPIVFDGISISGYDEYDADTTTAGTQHPEYTIQ